MSRAFLGILLAVNLAAITGITASAMMHNDSQDSTHLQEQITTHLERFLEHGVDGSFLIIEDKNTKKFVQFENHNNKLIFDLPLKALSPPEQSRAVRVLSEYGFAVQTDPLLDGPGGNIVDYWSGWNVELPGAATQGGEIGGRVFYEVFQLAGDIELSVAYGK